MGLGEKLVEKGLINSTQLEQALQESRKTGIPLKQSILKLGFIDEEIVSHVQAEEVGLPFINLSDYLIDQQVLRRVPEEMARRYMLIPLFKIGSVLTVAMANPYDVMAIDEVRLQSGCEVEPVVSTQTAIQKAIDQYYGMTQTVDQIVKAIDLDSQVSLDKTDIQVLEKGVEEAPIVKLVNFILTRAIREGASDIHIEPEEASLEVRFRLDGALHQAESPPKHLQSAIISRIKVLAGMDIAEKRKPQDGRIKLKMEGREIDIRISTFPTAFGENVVLRLLDRSRILLGLDELGFSPEVLKQYQQLVVKPYGLILVTGPTGSGKTTSLYTTLNGMDYKTKHILTLEDPIEYHLKGIRQAQVNPKVGLTFASGLRSMLRQDPDVIMVGEIRDSETAEISIQAALTGHLVLATLHTNNAAGALTRLIDMEIEPFLVSSSVIGVLAQRLVRKVCERCKETFQPPQVLLEQLGLSKIETMQFHRGAGCRHCRSLGYNGRGGIFELLLMDEAIRRLVIERASTQEIQETAQQHGMKVLRQDGLAKAALGITTLEEVLHVTQDG